MPCLIVRVGHQDVDRIHDLGDAGLVVGAEQGRAVGGDDVVADLVLQRRVVGDADDLRGDRRAGRCRRPDSCARSAASRPCRCTSGEVSMWAQKQMTGTVFVGIRRHGRVDVAELIEMRVGDADLVQLLHQQPPEVLLLFGRGIGRRGMRRLGVDLDVTQEAFGDGVRISCASHPAITPKAAGKCILKWLGPPAKPAARDHGKPILLRRLP